MLCSHDTPYCLRYYLWIVNDGKEGLQPVWGQLVGTCHHFLSSPPAPTRASSCCSPSPTPPPPSSSGSLNFDSPPPHCLAKRQYQEGRTSSSPPLWWSLLFTGSGDQEDGPKVLSNLSIPTPSASVGWLKVERGQGQKESCKDGGDILKLYLRGKI